MRITRTRKRCVVKVRISGSIAAGRTLHGEPHYGHHASAS